MKAPLILNLTMLVMVYIRFYQQMMIHLAKVSEIYLFPDASFYHCHIVQLIWILRSVYVMMSCNCSLSNRQCILPLCPALGEFGFGETMLVRRNTTIRVEPVVIKANAKWLLWAQTGHLSHLINGCIRTWASSPPHLPLEIYAVAGH